jgi:hypothetical protein
MSIGNGPASATRLNTGSGRELLPDFLPRVFELFGPRVPWSRTTFAALLALIVLWLFRLYATWATWGDLTIDCGHEMYVPALLSEGRMLYRDVWYMYPPGAPYLNSVLFRTFGVHLSVLYWAGSVSALACAMLIYLTGMELSSWIAGWTVAAIVLLQSFQRGIFNFALPYAFASVYGCLSACLFLWFAIRASVSAKWIWMFGAGCAAAAAFLFKPEYGMACYLTLILLMVVRAFQRSWKLNFGDFLAVVPGITVCALVAKWMFSIAGIEFITQENIMTWPTSYFMRNYGSYWLKFSGFSLSLVDVTQAIFRTIFLIGTIVLLHRALSAWQSDRRTVFVAASLFLIVSAFAIYWLPSQVEVVLRGIFLPQDMPLDAGIAAVACWWYFSRHSHSKEIAAFAILLTFSSLVATRILFAMDVINYSIYYNAPAILSFLLLARAVLPYKGRSKRFAIQAEVLLCLTCLLMAFLLVIRLPWTKELAPLTTERGTIWVLKDKAESYRLAIQFIKDEAARGESVLSVPEDTSLYFLTATHCPTRVFVFSPGVLSPGKMTDEVIRDIDQQHVRYLLWSNRTFPEYGVPLFGTDFDRPLGDYLRSHYRFVRPLTAVPGGWSADIWERKAEPSQAASSAEIE